MIFSEQFVQALLIVTAISTDAFVSAFSYGTNKIKIPTASMMVVNLTCSIMLFISLYLGNILNPYLPAKTTKLICFFILFVIALTKIFDSTVKALIKKHNKFNKKIQFSLFSLGFVLNVYANPSQADIDNSKTLSKTEAFFLAVALSLDGLAVGFGAGLANASLFLILILSLFSDMLAILGGQHLGSKLASKTQLNFNWISGFLLLILAVLKLF